MHTAMDGWVCGGSPCQVAGWAPTEVGAVGVAGVAAPVSKKTILNPKQCVATDADGVCQEFA